MKTTHIYVQGSVAFGNYISEIENKYGIYFIISGKYIDTFYNINPIFIENSNDEIPHYNLKFLISKRKPKNSINFEEFIKNYVNHFEQQLTHSSKEAQIYSII